MTTVGVVGLGKLGTPFAYVLAAAGLRVYAWDNDPKVRGGVQVPPPPEPGLAQLMVKHRLPIVDPKTMGESCDVIFIVVPTPSLPDGSFSTEQVEDVIQHIGSGGVTISIVSTVSPGQCEQLWQSGPQLRRLVYSPLLVALGSVLTDLQAATVWIIGAAEEIPSLQVADILGRVSPRARIMHMSFATAELAKLAVNVKMTVDIAFANELQEMAHDRRADIDAITDVLYLGLKRSPVLAGGTIGGPCLPRDVLAFAQAGGSFGSLVDLLDVGHLGWVLAQALADPRPATFAVLGMAYKPGVAYEIESFGSRLVAELHELGLTDATLNEADVVIVALPMPGWRFGELDALKDGARVIDVWRTHRYLAHVEGVDYRPLGAA